MGKKYLDIKEGSLEQSVLGVWQTAIEEGDERVRVDGRTKNYKEHRAKLEAARLRREKKNLNKEEVELDEGSKEEYQKFFNAAMKKFKIDSPADLKSDEDKKKFFDYVDKNYKGEKDEEFQKLHQQLFPEADVKEEVELDEKVEYVEYKFKNKNDAMKAKAYFDGIQLMSFDVNDDGASQGELAVDAGNRDMTKYHKEVMKKFKPKVMKQEKVEVQEGKMSQLHQLIKDKKSAEEISKIMRLDLKSVKALMANYMSSGYHESYEIGTDKYRKHTEDVTPGEDGDWVNAQKSKNDSMREALAKVWGFTEDKNPFKKESKKDLTKEVKDGKTMTGKKVASVEMNPTIKEKKK